MREYLVAIDLEEPSIPKPIRNTHEAEWEGNQDVQVF
jgi:hypothetical protein